MLFIRVDDAVFMRPRQGEALHVHEKKDKKEKMDGNEMTAGLTFNLA